MLSRPVSAQQKPSEMQSPSGSEEGSTGIGSEREETLADNTEDPSVDLLAKRCVNYCRTNGIENPVEILRYAQSLIVRGRPLDVQDVSESLEGETNFILINRQDVLKSAMDEIQFLKDPTLTLSIGFYGECAEDYGGPRKEFFRLCLRDIKVTYFDNGLKDHLADDYSTIGLIMALSTLQNGNIPRFLREDHLQALFSSQEPSNPCIAKLQIGFKNLGLFQIGNAIPNFLHLFRPSQSYAMSRRMLMTLLLPNFSEEGSNARRFETEIYELFSKYTRLTASGQRGAITLGHILQFVTGSDEERPLGLLFRQQVIAQTPTQNALFYLLLTHVQIPCTYQDVQMSHCCQVRSNYLIFMTWPLQMHILESCNVLIRGYKKLTLFICFVRHKNLTN